MTIAELVAHLTRDGVPQDAQVILSSDGEGNNFSPLADLGLATYEDGEVGDSIWPNAVILWPI